MRLFENMSHRNLLDHCKSTVHSENKAKSVSIIVLNRNGSVHLKNFFKSYLSQRVYQNVEIIVVDHASSDDSVDTILSFSDEIDIQIVLLDSNSTFSASNNLAAKKSKARYLFFVNNDIIFLSDPIPRLLSHMDNPDVGIVGMKLLHPVYDPKVKMDYVDFISQKADYFVRETNEGCPMGPEREISTEHIAIQHAGVKFFEDPWNDCYRAYNMGERYGTDPFLQKKGVFPAVTGAALFCRREEFLRIGGFCEKYVYGMEDIDLCLSYMNRWRKSVFLMDDVSLVHNESSTQSLENREGLMAIRKKNWQVLKERFGYLFNRVLLRDRLSGRKFWSDGSLTIAFAVTETGDNARAGDYFTAWEFGTALEEAFGWTVRYLSRNENWYDVRGVDILVTMVDAYDLSKIKHEKPGLIKVAWLRNWFERWPQRPGFDDYDLYLCSSKKGADFIADLGKKSHIFPIGTNAARFRPRAGNQDFSCDCCFTGSFWNAPRDMETMIDPDRYDFTFALYGSGWGRHDKFLKYWRGFVRYENLNAVYSGTKIVLDDANHVTKSWGSINSRVFDALASGALIITNNKTGSLEMFAGRLPSYETSSELHALIETYLGDESARIRLVDDLRKTVLENHTYRHRAYQFQSILTEYCEKKYRIAIKVPVPRKEERENWGDYHFALALKRAFVRLGHSVRIDLLPDWDTPLGLGDNVVLVLRGLSRYRPKREHINLMWNISHPDRVPLDEYEEYDHVFVASVLYADMLGRKISKPVSCLHQCTDPSLFYQDVVDSAPEHELLFVGNSRNQYRPIVRDAIESGLPLSVYGTLWERIIPDFYIRGSHIRNTELRHYYSRCKILLNDHWPSMREHGFVSNRIFDAGACGTCVISDEVSEIRDLFGDCVVTYRSPDELKKIVNHLLSNEDERKEKGEKLRNIVSNGHSFENRVEEVLKIIKTVAGLRGFGHEIWGPPRNE